MTHPLTDPPTHPYDTLSHKMTEDLARADVVTTHPLIFVTNTPMTHSLSR